MWSGSCFARSVLLVGEFTDVNQQTLLAGVAADDHACAPMCGHSM
jgi:hypothetical protein